MSVAAAAPAPAAAAAAVDDDDDDEHDASDRCRLALDGVAKPPLESERDDGALLGAVRGCVEHGSLEALDADIPNEDVSRWSTPALATPDAEVLGRPWGCAVDADIVAVDGAAVAASSVAYILTVSVATDSVVAAIKAAIAESGCATHSGQRQAVGLMWAGVVPSDESSRAACGEHNR